jgi:hypothetical protein
MVDVPSPFPNHGQGGTSFATYSLGFAGLLAFALRNFSNCWNLIWLL